MNQYEDRYFESARLRLHYVAWGDESKPPLLLVHGTRDHARSWDFVAQGLLDRYAVYALDLRGHGDSDWAQGGPYGLADYVSDMARFVETLGRGPVSIVGHSLGGRVSLDYASAFPDNVTKLVCIEGTGHFRPQMPPDERIRRHVADIADLTKRQSEPRLYKSIEAAAERMIEENKHLTPAMARHLTEHAVRRREDGTYIWKFDLFLRLAPLHEWSIPDTKLLWSNLTARVLLVGGSESWWPKQPNREELSAAIPGARTVIFDNAGHWVHHDQLDGFVATAREFLEG
ncbi:MAG TPA: alpha/beta hydrolase [Dehalococcoidia bacterium]|nr:alpha/beta hydrolase [Dehalococcoidia bacterium]